MIELAIIGSALGRVIGSAVPSSCSLAAVPAVVRCRDPTGYGPFLFLVNAQMFVSNLTWISSKGPRLPTDWNCAIYIPLIAYS
jgi:hypothetical protein